MAKTPQVLVIEVTWRRRKGKPVEAVQMMTGGLFAGLLVAQEVAKQLKVPQSWVNPVFYDDKKHRRWRVQRRELLAKVKAAAVREVSGKQVSK